MERMRSGGDSHVRRSGDRQPLFSLSATSLAHSRNKLSVNVRSIQLSTASCSVAMVEMVISDRTAQDCHSVRHRLRRQRRAVHQIAEYIAARRELDALPDIVRLLIERRAKV